VPRPIHFEIHAGNPERVQAFYTKLFGNICGIMQTDISAK
jgi:predicted enzyme related to lactoylglutathione lyase